MHCQDRRQVVTNMAARCMFPVRTPVLFLQRGAARPRNVMPVRNLADAARQCPSWPASTGVPQVNSVGRERCQRLSLAFAGKAESPVRCRWQDVRRRRSPATSATITLRRAAHFVVGLCRGDRRGQTWHQPGRWLRHHSRVSAEDLSSNPPCAKVEAELESLVAANVTVGSLKGAPRSRWVGKYRRQ